MKPIPEQAMQVIKVLRRDVPRPKELPDTNYFGAGLRWTTPKGKCSPMGLHVDSTDPVPQSHREFPLATRKAIHSFWDWWDYIKVDDAPEAMNMIWGTE